MHIVQPETELAIWELPSESNYDGTVCVRTTVSNKMLDLKNVSPNL